MATRGDTASAASRAGQSWVRRLIEPLCGNEIRLDVRGPVLLPAATHQLRSRNSDFPSMLTHSRVGDINYCTAHEIGRMDPLDHLF